MGMWILLMICINIDFHVIDGVLDTWIDTHATHWIDMIQLSNYSIQ